MVHPDDLAGAGAALAKLKNPGDRASNVICRIRCKDKSYRWLSWNSVVAREGIAFAVAQDITERKQVEGDLLHAASHDAVTNLPHRLYFERQLTSMRGDESHPVWVLLVGIDRFQAVNEFMGHAIGDDVLRRIADRLRGTLDESARIARFAGDQFVIALADLDMRSTLNLAEQLRDVVAAPIESDEYRLVLTASVGISRSPEHGRTSQELLSCAEAAMVRAKRRGRDGVCLFTDEQMKGSEERLALGRNLRGALERGEMSLHYQPVRRASDRKLSGFEALLRWNSPEFGLIAPDLFIPIAETMGMMPDIGEWVLEHACRQARIWHDCGCRDFVIAVNVSAQELQRPNLTDVVSRTLSLHSIPASLLVIEITESSLMENIDRVRATLGELKRMGVRLSLDDFGTGYSSLAYLKQFPIDTLKIDQRFVRGLPYSDEDAAIARTIVVMGHQLRMRVSAEGVETEEQAEFLGKIGCDELQGYHLGRPAPAEIAEAALESTLVT
ncbi:EAL domain-containing protein, partial [Dokdonella sp.]|uniref:putative bifunctional diguanylate cyclase/phosphodiesterase n=1 Tax=Dokdonella sp. TaxID=2291710 RepID=UPI003C54C300